MSDHEWGLKTNQSPIGYSVEIDTIQIDCPSVLFTILQSQRIFKKIDLHDAVFSDQPSNGLAFLYKSLRHENSFPFDAALVSLV